MNKVTIIGGAGTLGSACAFQLAAHPAIDEIGLIDVNKNLLDNHVMDLQNAYPHKEIYRGDNQNLENTDIVLITAGIPNRNNVQSRQEFLDGNIQLFREFGTSIKKYAPEALIITASNPVDVLNYYLHEAFHFSRRQLIGYTLNDSFRFEWAIRRVLSFSRHDYIEASVLGEHGDAQVPVFSRVKRNNEPFSVDAFDQQKIRQMLQTWFQDFNQLNVNRTTGWTTAYGIGVLVDKLLQDNGQDTIASSVLQGEYGVSHVSLGVPVTVNKQGIQQVHEWMLSSEEAERFQRAKDAVASLIRNYI
ncbi:malate dehydrogenase (NAD) [Alteribacillus persepolensis]|uniref:Malate dehydrogenase (NAD) n=1 Tax=Alteribacillus persepolensis TaxID=568899 RepID=A0A1G8A6D9_9BACI|nr:hypothetical protein [Alteribacillus persepolensis]SDH16417.1 malate dehydrogenase (NAD) [Alteribacillus persepolensis]